MRILVAKSSGFCRGVKNAIEIAKKCGKCQTYGELLHNEYALKLLEEHGVHAIKTLDEYTGEKLVIRSHGVGKSVYEELKKKGVDYIDATCIFVKKIHQIVAEFYAKGYRIIIVGNSNHPEVIGINGWCENSAIIIDNVENLTLDNRYNYCVVSQTTFDKNKYENIAKFLEKCLKTVVIHNTICYTTYSRQKEAETLSQECDVMLVIGSKTSSNTRKLFDISSSHCEHTYFISTLSDLRSVNVAKNIKKLGIIAGASTPEELIKEVITQMNDSQKTNNEKDLFGAMLEQSDAKTAEVKAGKLFKECKVILANENGIAINFGGKKDGFIDKSEVEVDGVEYNPDNYKPGDIIAAIVVEKSGKKDNDCISFSKKAYDMKTIVAKESEEKLRSSEFKATVESVVKNGLKLHVGPYEVFVPASQIKIGYVTEEDLKKYVGKTLRLRVIKGKNEDPESDIVIKRNKTVIASQRVILEEEKEARENALWEVLQTGNIVTGKVRRFADFGAFVNVNGFDCLVHISDISHYKIAHPSEVFEIGKSYEFVILKADRESQKVSLGYKQLQKKPYEIAAEKYPVGSVVTGKVRTVLPYGAFVLIERDVDGLIPVSEIAHTFTKSATDVYHEGDEVTAQVIKFEGNKITLSVKALLDKPEVEEEEISDEDIQAAKEKRASKLSKKFDTAVSAPRKTRVKKEDKEEEPTSWTSDDAATATLGDLFKGFKFDNEDK